jgi:site-specific recombinase XerD
MKTIDAISEFLKAAQADGLSPATVKWYTSLLKAWADQSPAAELSAVVVGDLRAYIIALRERPDRYVDALQKPVQAGGLSAATVAGHITALHAFWAWAAREYDIPNPMKNIKRPRRQQPQPKAISPADFVKLFNATGDDEAGVRDRALLVFLADTGCRLGGLLGLQVERLMLDDRKAIVHEKGNTSRLVVFTTYTARLLVKWLTIRQSHTAFVFVSMHTGEKLTQSGVNQLLKRLKQRAGVRGRVNPHSFRHNFAREYLRNGGDVVTLAKLLGHKNVNTTAQYYAVFSPDELRELHEKYSPLNGLIV